MGQHAVFSASGSYRWLACPGSISLSEGVPKQPDSVYAREGTIAHECLQEVIENYLAGKPLKKFKGENKDEYTDEMIAHAIVAFEYVRELYVELPHSEFLCETKVDLSFVHPGMFGTCDIALYEPFGRLHVIDYKFGAGIPVEPEENSQLAYYALGIAQRFDWNFEDVVLTVIQPRALHEKGPVRTSIISAEELKKWEGIFRSGVEAALAFNENISKTYYPGDHCRFCPASHICPALSEESFKSAQIDFAPTEGTVSFPVKEWTGKELGFILKAADQIETWIESVRTYAFNRLSRGEAVPGFKLVPKRSTRKWVGEEFVAKEAKKKWGKKAFSEPELLSPAQLEKATKDKDWVENRVTNVSPGLTLAPDSDKRSAVLPLEQDFPSLEGDNQDKKKKGKK